MSISGDIQGEDSSKIWLVLGDKDTGKSTALTSYFGPPRIDSEVSLYVKDDPGATFKALTIWDCKSHVNSLGYFMFVDNTDNVLIFCNLSNAGSCDAIGHWYTFAEKYVPGAQVIIIGTHMSQRRDLDNNRLRVLTWCAAHEDLPFFSLELSDRDAIENIFGQIMEA